MSALDKQISGSHYKNQKVQPIELAYMLGQTPAFCKVAKYATRIKDDPVEQLNKALHCIELDEELFSYHKKYTKVHEDHAWEVIRDFTEDRYLKRVLYNMHCCNFQESKYWLSVMIARQEEERE